MKTRKAEKDDLNRIMEIYGVVHRIATDGLEKGRRILQHESVAGPLANHDEKWWRQ